MVKSTFEKLQNVKVCTGVLMCMISSLDLAAYLLARMFIVYKHIVLDTALWNSQPTLRFRDLNPAKAYRKSVQGIWSFRKLGATLVTEMW